jgi:hypothetical protein
MKIICVEEDADGLATEKAARLAVLGRGTLLRPDGLPRRRLPAAQ